MPYRRVHSFLRSSGLLTLSLIAAAMLTSQAVRAADTIAVVLDQARVLQLPDRTSTIILGNPGIADVTLLKKSNSMVLTGKAFGETNLIALDAQGNSLGESLVRVSGGTGAVIVQAGMTRRSFSCTPRCQPTVTLGDETAFITDTSSQIQSRNQLAQPANGAQR